MKKLISHIGLVALLCSAALFSAQGQSRSTSRTVTSNSDGITIKVTNGDHGFDVNYDGDIKFNDAFTDVSYISPGGYITISKTSFGNKRRLELKGATGGTIEREFWDGGTEKPYEPAGRKFLEEMLPRLFNSTRLGAEDRVNKLFAKGGSKAVIEDIEDKDSDYIKGYYFDLALHLSNARESDKVAFLRAAGRELDSSFELSRLLQSVGSEMLKSKATSDALLEAIAEIDSDFETSKVLRELLVDVDLKDPRMVTILEGMDSDFEKSRLLLEAIKQPDLTKDELNTVLRLLENVDSDFEKSRVMREVVNSRALELEGVEMVMERLDEMDSDFEQSRILQDLVRMYELEDRALSLALKAMDELDSDFEKSRVLQMMLTEQEYSEAAFVEMLKHLENIESSFEQSRLLGMMLQEEARSAATFDLLLKSITNLDSDFEKSKLLKEAAQLPNLKVSDYEGLIKATSDLGSFEARDVYLAIIDHMPNNEDLKNLLRKAAENLDDHDYAKVIRALNQ